MLAILFLSESHTKKVLLGFVQTNPLDQGYFIEGRISIAVALRGPGQLYRRCRTLDNQERATKAERKYQIFAAIYWQRCSS